MKLFCVLLTIGLLVSYLPAAAQRRAAKPAVPQPASSFYATYAYLTYTILDRTSDPQPVAARGVGGTLALHPDGTYQKRLTLAGNGGTMRFEQDGRFTFAGYRISFAYTKNGQPRTDEGTFELRNGVLTITLQGYPAGNESTYTLRAQ